MSGKETSKTGKVNPVENKVTVEPDIPRSFAVAQRGVKDIGDFAEMMSCLMSDVVLGSIQPNVASACVNAGGKLLKATEMKLRYQQPEQPKNLPLVE